MDVSLSLSPPAFFNGGVRWRRWCTECGSTVFHFVSRPTVPVEFQHPGCEWQKSRLNRTRAGGIPLEGSSCQRVQSVPLQPSDCRRRVSFNSTSRPSLTSRARQARISVSAPTFSVRLPAFERRKCARPVAHDGSTVAHQRESFNFRSMRSGDEGDEQRIRGPPPCSYSLLSSSTTVCSTLISDVGRDVM